MILDGQSRSGPLSANQSRPPTDDLVGDDDFRAPAHLQIEAATHFDHAGAGVGHGRADQDVGFAVLIQLLQSRGDVEHVAHGVELTLPVIAQLTGSGGAGVNGDPDPEIRAAVVAHVAAEALDGTPHVERRRDPPGQGALLEAALG